MESKLSCIIIDDEAPAHIIIEQYISKIPFLILSAKFRNLVQAGEWLKQHTADILFLDIQMPGQSGMDFLKTRTGKSIVIFTTAYSEFAAEAFELNALDYLLKPFSFGRFSKVANKAREHITLLKQPAPDQSVKTPEEYITVKANGIITKIHIQDIIYIEGFQEYIKIYTAKGRLITYERLKNIEKILPQEQFMRIHKSYIVALRHATGINGYTLMLNDIAIPISRDLKDIVHQRIF
jgi:DNA-binding LytR/AlgR family response regulator